MKKSGAEITLYTYLLKEGLSRFNIDELQHPPLLAGVRSIAQDLTDNVLLFFHHTIRVAKRESPAIAPGAGTVQA